MIGWFTEANDSLNVWEGTWCYLYPCLYRCPSLTLYLWSTAAHCIWQLWAGLQSTRGHFTLLALNNLYCSCREGEIMLSYKKFRPFWPSLGGRWLQKPTGSAGGNTLWQTKSARCAMTPHVFVFLSYQEAPQPWDKLVPCISTTVKDESAPSKANKHPITTTT